MNNRRALLPVIVLYCAACATTAPHPPAAAVASPLVSAASRSEAKADGATWRAHLEEAYAEIIAHETPSKTPEADFEAAASLPIPEHPTIRGALNYFTTGLRDDIQASLLRSGKYRLMIDKTLDQQNLPRGLAYLPVIESAYATTLTSRAGAHGMWQFMPETAREYGLRVDWWVDERADPERSTRAAAAYLKDLYREFNDWPLVLAAYNAGPGRVRRALTETGATNFWELLDMAALPKETRGYVPTFYATLLIACQPDSYGFTLGPPVESDIRSVTIEGPLSLRFLAEVSNADERLLRELNPALRRGLVPPGGVAVRMPPKAAAAVADRASSLKNEDATIAVCAFTMRRGDTLRAVAGAVGATPETVAAMNGLSSTTAAGQGDTIFLPVRARELGARLSHWNDRRIFYAVRKGDTMYSIARRHHLTVDELRELNELVTHARLRPGQKLRVSPGRGLAAGGM